MLARHAGTVCMAELATMLKVSQQTVYDVMNRQRDTGNAAALPRSGRPNVLTQRADEAVFARLSEGLQNISTR